ncbi:MAG: peptide deformylase [Patescibacteria group bacterium]|nr:peptide deformylase [Patescibacteria group bacterium]
MTEEVLQVGEPILREKAALVAKDQIPSEKIRALIAHMKELLSREKNGVGLAAPQVGESLRIFIISGRAFLPDEEEEDVVAEEEKKEEPPPPPDMVFINPEMMRRSRAKKEMSEGCISVRGKYGTVMRSEKVTIQALNEVGRPFTYHGSGLVAHIFQHEMDHLEGILYIDKAVKLEDEGEKSHLREEFPPGEKEHRQV